jgi:hypothetical protein
MDLFQYKQNQGEALKDYYQKFVQIKAKAPNVPKDFFPFYPLIALLYLSPCQIHVTDVSAPPDMATAH